MTARIAAWSGAWLPVPVNPQSGCRTRGPIVELPDGITVQAIPEKLFDAGYSGEHLADRIEKHVDLEALTTLIMQGAPAGLPILPPGDSR